MQTALEVDREHPLEILVGVIEQGLADVDAGGRDQPVEATVTVGHGTKRLLDRGSVDQINTAGLGQAPRTPDLAGSPFGSLDIEIEENCAARSDSPQGFCYRIVYRPTESDDPENDPKVGFAGIFWQYPAGNRGQQPGRLVQKGAIKMLDLLETSTLVPGPDGGWLYAAGDVSYEATPIVEGDAAELDRSTDQEQ